MDYGFSSLVVSAAFEKNREDLRDGIVFFDSPEWRLFADFNKKSLCMVCMKVKHESLLRKVKAWSVWARILAKRLSKVVL